MTVETVRVAKTCGTCGTAFEVIPSAAKAGRGKYCSAACSPTGPKIRAVRREVPPRIPAGLMRVTLPRYRWPIDRHRLPARCAHCQAKLLVSDVPTAEHPKLDVTCYQCSQAGYELVYDGVIRSGPLAIDLTEERVTVNGESIRISPTEWAFLARLARGYGRPTARKILATEVLGPTFTVPYVETLVHRLRAKLGAAAHLIEREPGRGYRLRQEAPR